MTKFQDYDRILEAHYFISKQHDPYIIENIFQKPLLGYPFYYLRKIPYLELIPFIICDIIIAYLIQTREFLHNRKNDETIYQRDRRIFLFVYLFNPLTFCGIIVKWTGIFDVTFSLLGVYLLSQKKYDFLAAFFFAFGIYLNPVNITLVSVVLIMTNFTPQLKTLKELIKFFLLVGMYLILMLIYSAYLTGSFNFLNTCYLKAYHTNLYEPSIGLIWTLFSGMFNRYQAMYHTFIFLMPFSFIYPLKKIYGKIVKQYKWSRGLLAYACGSSLLIGYIFFSFITIFEFSIIVTLLYTGYEFIFKVKLQFIFNYAISFIMILTSGLTGLWKYSLIGNPNFCFS